MSEASDPANVACPTRVVNHVDAHPIGSRPYGLRDISLRIVDGQVRTKTGGESRFRFSADRGQHARPPELRYLNEKLTNATRPGVNQAGVARLQGKRRMDR